MQGDSSDEEEMDEDTMLAAAAAAAENHEAEKPRRRERLKSLFSSIGKKDHSQDAKPAAEEPRLSAKACLPWAHDHVHLMAGCIDPTLRWIADEELIEVMPVQSALILTISEEMLTRNRLDRLLLP